MKNWALIKNNRVVNIAVGDDNFPTLVLNEYDDIIDITTVVDPPHIGDTYISSTFGDNPDTVVGAGYSTDTPVTPNFIPFVLDTESGGFSVTHYSDTVTIGCRTYNAAWLRDTVKGVLASLPENPDPITVVSELGNSGDQQRYFKVTDLQAILAVLT